jgi:hypothetical protein
MSGTPVAPAIGSKPNHLPGPDWAKRVDRPSCVSLRMLMPHRSAVCQAEKLTALRATENKMRGGSNDTELKELTVKPCSNPSGPRAVTIAIPVGKTPSAERNSCDVNAIAFNSTQRTVHAGCALPIRVQHRCFLVLVIASLPITRDGVINAIGGQQVIHHAASGAPIEGAVTVTCNDEARAGVEHLILCMARAEFRTDSVPGCL